MFAAFPRLVNSEPARTLCLSRAGVNGNHTVRPPVSRCIRLAFAVVMCALLGSAITAERALRDWRHPSASPLDAAALGFGWRTAQVNTSDHLRLRAWLFTPPHPNGGAVILMHGVTGSRIDMLPHAAYLLRAGYTVLTPDNRGRGTSEGHIVTYGLREADDVHRWASLLLAEPEVHRLFGLGVSMGASSLLESLPAEPRFRAVVADCPFADFESVAYHRLALLTHLPEPLFWPVVQLGFSYTQLLYRIDLHAASPATVIPSVTTPVLLIHGTADAKTPVEHSRRLHALNTGSTRLLEIRHAGHAASFRVEPDAYRRAVLDWFESHQ